MKSRKWIFVLLVSLMSINTIYAQQIMGCYGVISPDPKWKICVGNTRLSSQATDEKALEYARLYILNIKRIKPWPEYRIFVFNDDKTSLDFDKFLKNPKRIDPLTASDYPKLTEIWKHAQVCYVLKEGDKQGKAYYPSRNPTGWWKPLVPNAKNKATTR